jgi:hypothetical protein
MARFDDVQDSEVRGLLEKATMEMRGGDPTSAVWTCCKAFARLVSLKSELLGANLPADEKIHHQQFPRLGANLIDAEGTAEFVFEREHFSLSDAITYLDFTTDVALKQQL